MPNCEPIQTQWLFMGKVKRVLRASLIVTRAIISVNNEAEVGRSVVQTSRPLAPLLSKIMKIAAWSTGTITSGTVTVRNGPLCRCIG